VKYLPMAAILTMTILDAFECQRHEPPLPCPLCVDPAFEITMMDSNGTKINGFTIKATKIPGDTTISSDSLAYVQSSYLIYGSSGLYNLEITSPNYETITIDSIVVDGGRCGPNARILGIIAKEPRLSKELNVPYIMAFDSSRVGCGN
jgi:hypothetical protein